jgi:hypothetical protein
MTRDLNKAVPLLKVFGEELIKRSKSDFGLTIIITCVDRTILEQMALVIQGRLKLKSVNIARITAGLSPLKSEEENKIVSWTLDSKHVINPFDTIIDNDKSRAFDFGVLDSNGKYMGDLKADVNGDNISDYEQVCLLGKKIAAEIDLPIVFGKDFSTQDYPHIQYGA